MTGQEYLEEIRTNLRSGRNQHRMGENILRAFGYVRRRATAIEEINGTLEQLGLLAHPPINSEMPLKVPRIRFSLSADTDALASEAADSQDTLDSGTCDSPLQDVEDEEDNLPEPAFSVSELASANTAVECVSPNASIHTAYTTMLLRNFSQLVVAEHPKPMQQAIKGTVSFQSIAKAMMNGEPATVGDCIDNDVSFAQSDSDLKTVVSQLGGNDVVLVIGRHKRLQGIVTAWDLAEEFAGLVDPFTRIGEIEDRLQTVISKRLGKQKVAEFFTEQGLLDEDSIKDPKELTLGELEKVMEFPKHWDALRLPYDRKIFIGALRETRGYRNRLMHFRDPLTEAEMTHLTNFCDTVRELQL